MKLKSKKKVEMLVEVAYNHHKLTGYTLDTSYLIGQKYYMVMLQKLEELLNADNAMDNIAYINIHADGSAGMDTSKKCFLEFKWSN